MKNLNTSQKQAVEYNDGPLLIVAGAGTGKTTVITEKISYIIEKNLAKPENILALTFTEKAASEMQERVDEMLDTGYVDLQISTFHAFCQRILEEYGIEIGLPLHFTLMTQTDVWLLMKKHIYDFELDYYRPMGNPTGMIHEMIAHFSKAKDELISSEEYMAYAEGLGIDTDSKIKEKELVTSNSKLVNKKEQKQVTNYKLQVTDDTEIKKYRELANAYKTYNQLLLDNEALDFGDLMYYMVRLLKERPNVLAALKERFTHILVDEFQDVNWSQYQLIRLLADSAQLTVVGDDDQCLPGNTKIHVKYGTKKIKDIKRGDQVISAVSKGYYTLSNVHTVKKNTKKSRFVHIKTQSGKELRMTDNHIVFCHTPHISDKKTYYVYVMYRKNWGWRMGITNDLAVRLRLERGADGIIAIKGCKDESEARFYETIYSLKYNIPTVCFKERDGGIQNKQWLKQVFDTIDTEKNIHVLARDLHIDLSSYHVVLDAVNRGDMKRIKINLTTCYRKYGNKLAQGPHIDNPQVRHMLHLEISDRKIIDIVQRLGFSITQAKKGFRLRKMSIDYATLEHDAQIIAVATGGYIDRMFKIGRTEKNRSIKSILLPAKNLMLGLSVPVYYKTKGMVYEKIVDISYDTKKETVYDLEIDRTHNFIANGIAVHNSIYSFRGSNVSIIMRFMDDFKDAKSIVLNENYRSGQKILDFAYESIKHNNPERLEETLHIDKRLKSKGKREKGKVEHLHFQTLDDEVYGTIDKIKELIEKEDAKLDDIAILVRANAHVEPFVQALEQHEIPFEYIASSGLYRQPVVLDSMSFLQLLTHVYDDRAIYRLLRMPMFDMSENDIQKLTARAKQKSINYYEALKRGKEFHLSQNAINICDQVIELIHNGMKHARYEKPTVVLYHFLEQSGYLKHLAEGETAGDRNIIRQIYHVKQLFDMIRNFEMITPDSQVSEFIEYYNNIIESGDNGKMYQPGDTPDSVNIITVHSAKGLEYKYVFVVNMVEERFPTRRKGGGLDLPQALLKDTLPDNDFHYQEERRLFYVAVTRAKEKLFLTSAEDYGGSRKKKISRFISELQLDTDEKPALETKHIDALHQEKKATREDDEFGVFEFTPPKKFSFSQINVYQRCPYQYKLANILKIPKKSGPALSFGNSIHNTLQAFYEKVRSLNLAKQDSLFGMPIKTSAKVDNGIKVPDEKYLLDLYEEKWIGDWYKSKQQRETYKKKGVELLKVFYASQVGKWTIPVSIEGGFKIKIGEYILGGRIDRIDQREDGTLEIIDYKTGTAKEKLTTDDKQQLLIYYIAATSLPEYKNIGPVGELTFYYVNSDTKLSFQGKEKDVDKLKEKILDTINNIHKGDFTATPNPFVCKYCDFKDICEFRKL